MYPIRAIILLTIFLALTGCANLQQDPTRNWSAAQLYAEAKQSLNSGNYEQAIEYYELLEARYPFSRFAQQAQIEIAYTYYRARENAAAIVAVDRFIELNPRHPRLDYAYYLRGLINANQNEGFINRLFPIDPAELDPEPMKVAFQDFSRLIHNYPDSIYTEDARERMIDIRNALAAHELRVATFYMDRRAWAASAARAQYVIRHYQGSDFTPQALAILYRSYRQMDLPHLAEDTLRVLELNYPEAVTLATRQQPIVIRQGDGGVRGWMERLPFFAN